MTSTTSAMDLLQQLTQVTQVLSSKILEFPCSNSICSARFYVKLSHFLSSSDTQVHLDCAGCKQEILLRTFSPTSAPAEASSDYSGVQHIREMSTASFGYHPGWNKTQETVATATWYSSTASDDADDDDDGQGSMSVNTTSSLRSKPSTEVFTMPRRNTSSEFNLLLKGVHTEDQDVGGVYSRSSSSLRLSRISSFSTGKSQAGIRKSLDSGGGGRSRRNTLDGSEGSPKLKNPMRRNTDEEHAVATRDSDDTAFKGNGGSSSSVASKKRRERSRSVASNSTGRGGAGNLRRRVLLPRPSSLMQNLEDNALPTTNPGPLNLSNTSSEHVSGARQSGTSIQFARYAEVMEPDSGRTLEPLGGQSDDNSTLPASSQHLPSPVHEEFEESITAGYDGNEDEREQGEVEQDITASGPEEKERRTIHKTFSRLRMLPKRIARQTKSLFRRHTIPRRPSRHPFPSNPPPTTEASAFSSSRPVSTGTTITTDNPSPLPPRNLDEGQIAIPRSDTQFRGLQQEIQEVAQLRFDSGLTETAFVINVTPQST